MCVYVSAYIYYMCVCVLTAGKQKAKGNSNTALRGSSAAKHCCPISLNSVTDNDETYGGAWVTYYSALVGLVGWFFFAFRSFPDRVAYTFDALFSPINRPSLQAQGRQLVLRTHDIPYFNEVFFCVNFEILHCNWHSTSAFGVCSACKPSRLSKKNNIILINCNNNLRNLHECLRK